MKARTKKITGITLGVMFALSMIAAATAVYFHQNNISVIASEGRQSTDTDVTLNCFSGETITSDRTIVNLANVPLCTELTYEQVDNVNGVVYTHNLPMKVTTGALSTGTYTTSYTCGETTPAGTVNGKITYTPVAC